MPPLPTDLRQTPDFSPLAGLAGVGRYPCRGKGERAVSGPPIAPVGMSHSRNSFGPSAD